MESVTTSILFIILLILLIVIFKKKLFKYHEFYREKNNFNTINEVIDKLEDDSCRKKYLSGTYSFVDTDYGRATINPNENKDKKIHYINEINRRIEKLKDYMNKKYFTNKILTPGDYIEYFVEDGALTSRKTTKSKEELIKYFQNICVNMKNNYLPDNFVETIPSSKEGCKKNFDTSFVIGKGDVFSMCMENKKKIMHDFEFIFHVALHELAHLSDIEKTDHDSIFYNAFYTLKRNAFEANISHLLTLDKNIDLNYCDLMKITEAEFKKSNPQIEMYDYALQK